MVSNAQEQADELDLQFYVTPIQIVKGDSIRLEWESDGADYCTASGAWSGRKQGAGSTTMKPKKTGTYAIQCFDEDGTASKKITQSNAVVATKKQLKRKNLAKPTPVVTTPTHAGNDEDVVISWKTPVGTIACRAQGPQEWDGLKMPNGSETITADIGKEYALSCWNQNGETGAKSTWVFKQKPNKYTAPDVGLNSDYLPLYPDDAFLSDGTEVYFIDFIKKEERSPDTDDDDINYWGKRIVIDPKTNLRIEKADILKQLNAFPGQVPPDVDQSTKRISTVENLSYVPVYNMYENANDDLSRFTNDGEYSMNGEIPVLSPDAFGDLAIEYVLDYLKLPKTQVNKDLYHRSAIAIWFNGLVAGVPMYIALDVYNWRDEKIRTVVMDPSTGDDLTSRGSFDDGVYWDRAVLKKRDVATQTQPPLSIKGEPVGNPPTQIPVTPPVETKKEEPKQEVKQEVKKEEPKKEETTTKCSTGFIWSPTLGQCYEDTSAKQNTETQPTCAAGYSYSITLKQCVR